MTLAALALFGITCAALGFVIGVLACVAVARDGLKHIARRTESGAPVPRPRQRKTDPSRFAY